MPSPLRLSDRDIGLLRFLDRTPATADHVLRVSPALGEPFRDVRRTRERLQALADANLVQSFSLGGRTHANYYRLTPAGFRSTFPAKELPGRSAFESIPLMVLDHTMTLADVIVTTMVAAHSNRAEEVAFYRENSLSLHVGPHETKPDCGFRYTFAGRNFNLLFEIDNSTESIDSHYQNAIRQKLMAYEAYQDFAVDCWKQSQPTTNARPYFRVCFFTKSVLRAYHILSLARRLAKNPRRHLVYATTQAEYLSADQPLRDPLFLEHAGQWVSLLDPHPTAKFLRPPVELAEERVPTLTF